MTWTAEKRAEAGARLKASREAKRKQQMPVEQTTETTDIDARIAELEAKNRALAAQLENAGQSPSLPPGIGNRRLVGYVRSRPGEKWIAAQMIVDADIYRTQFIDRCDKMNLDQRIQVLQPGEEVAIKGFPNPPPTVIGAMDYARTGTA